MIIGFNPSYPALHMREALEAVVSGKFASLGWNSEDIDSVVSQAHTLICEREKSLTKNDLACLNALLGFIKNMEY